MSVSLQLRLDENMNNFVELDKLLDHILFYQFHCHERKKLTPKQYFFREIKSYKGEIDR